MGSTGQSKLGGKVIPKAGEFMHVQAVIVQLLKINIMVGAVNMANVGSVALRQRSGSPARKATRSRASGVRAKAGKFVPSEASASWFTSRWPS